MLPVVHTEVISTIDMVEDVVNYLIRNACRVSKKRYQKKKKELAKRKKQRLGIQNLTNSDMYSNMYQQVWKCLGFIECEFQITTSKKKPTKHFKHNQTTTTTSTTTTSTTTTSTTAYTTTSTLTSATTTSTTRNVQEDNASNTDNTNNDRATRRMRSTSDVGENNMVPMAIQNVLSKKGNEKYLKTDGTDVLWNWNTQPPPSTVIDGNMNNLLSFATSTPPFGIQLDLPWSSKYKGIGQMSSTEDRPLLTSSMSSIDTIKDWSNIKVVTTKQSVSTQTTQTATPTPPHDVITTFATMKDLQNADPEEINTILTNEHTEHTQQIENNVENNNIEKDTATENELELIALRQERLEMMHRISDLEYMCDTLQITNKDVIAEREVYRFELSNYKEAVLALRAAGCVPPRVVALPHVPGWSKTSPIKDETTQNQYEKNSESGEFKVLDQAIQDFVYRVQADSQSRLAAKMQALRHVKSAVCSIWPRAQVKVFGSFVTGLQLPSSDLDIVICLPNIRRVINRTLEEQTDIKETWQEQLTRRLQRCPWVLEGTLSKQGSAMPIISLATRPLGGQGLSGDSFSVRLDISILTKTHNGLSTNSLVQSLSRQHPALLSLTLIMKQFLKEHGFLTAFTGGLSSYGLVMLLTRFLQSRVESDESNEVVVGLGALLVSFLEFIGSRFNPRTTGVSVAHKCYISRTTSASSTGSVASLSTSSSKDNRLRSVSTASRGGGDDGGVSDAWSETGGSEYGMAQRYHKRSAPDPHKFDPLLIVDPLLSSNNIGRNCFRFAYVQRECAIAHAALMAACNSNKNKEMEHPIQILGAIIKDQTLLCVQETNEGSLTLSHVRKQSFNNRQRRGGGSMGGSVQSSNSDISSNSASPVRRIKSLYSSEHSNI